MGKGRKAGRRGGANKEGWNRERDLYHCALVHFIHETFPLYPTELVIGLHPPSPWPPTVPDYLVT